MSRYEIGLDGIDQYLLEYSKPLSPSLQSLKFNWNLLAFLEMLLIENPHATGFLQPFKDLVRSSGQVKGLIGIRCDFGQRTRGLWRCPFFRSTAPSVKTLP
jgi:hypothetical protein